MLKFIPVFVFMLVLESVNAQGTTMKNNAAFVKIIEQDTMGRLTVFINDSVNFEMIKIPGGTFNMGSESGYSNEKPVHKVMLDTYYIGTFEVTQKLWFAVIGENNSHFKNYSDCPVEMITFSDATHFIEVLNRETGLSFRLPTEAEWEYAASGGAEGKRTRYSGSNKIDDVAWYERNSESRTHSVGSKAANSSGIYDMSGNVYEWTQDWVGRYKSRLQLNPSGSEHGKLKVVRGGCWYDTRDGCRISCRVEMAPNAKNGCLGMRLVHSNPLNNNMK